MASNKLKLKPIQKQKIPEIIINELKEIIDSGQIQPGEKLPSERDLANMLNVSRSSLREALKSLSLLGILDNKTGKGTFLKTTPSRWPIEPFLIVSVESSNLLHLFEVRHELELVISRWAAERRTKSDLSKLKKILKKMKASIAQPKLFMEYELLFHRAVNDMARNDVMTDFMNVLYEQLKKTRQVFYDAYATEIPSPAGQEAIQKGETWGPENPKYLEDIVDKHNLIFEAIADGDPKMAEHYSREHMQLEFFKKHLRK